MGSDPPKKANHRQHPFIREKYGNTLLRDLPDNPQCLEDNAIG